MEKPEEKCYTRSVTADMFTCPQVFRMGKRQAELSGVPSR